MYIKGLKNFEEKQDNFDAKRLINEIKKAMVGIDEKSYKRMNLWKAPYALTLWKQGQNEANKNFPERLENAFLTLMLPKGEGVLQLQIQMDSPEAPPSKYGTENDEEKMMARMCWPFRIVKFQY